MRFRINSVLLFIAVVAMGLCAYRLWPIDGLIGNLFAIFNDEDTVWADGYTNEGWRSVAVGMKRDEVYALLGPPLDTQPTGVAGTLECWTRSPADTDYRRRDLEFSGDRIVHKWSEYWID